MWLLHGAVLPLIANPRNEPEQLHDWKPDEASVPLEHLVEVLLVTLDNEEPGDENAEPDGKADSEVVKHY